MLLFYTTLEVYTKLRIVSSVSDIVVLHQNDEDTAHYVDSIGFQQVPEFLQEQQTPVFDKLPPEQQQALSDTVQDTLQMLVDADKRI